MNKKSYGFKIRLGFNNVETLMDLLNVTWNKIRKDLIVRNITTGYKLTGIELVDNKDFSYSIMFNFSNEPSIERIFDRAITGEQTNEE